MNSIKLANILLIVIVLMVTALIVLPFVVKEKVTTQNTDGTQSTGAITKSLKE